jgi:hypothetical protein
MNAIQFHLKRLGACKSALKWARTQDNPLDAWRACPRGDWLLHLAVRLGGEHRAVVLAACTCAKLGLPYTRDERPLQAILMTEAWILGDKTITAQDMRDAAKECDDAAGYAECFAQHAAASAAYAAMYATIAALPGKTPKGAAGDAAAAVAEAAADAAPNRADGDAARVFVQQACANIVRSKIDEDAIMRLWWVHVTGQAAEEGQS